MSSSLLENLKKKKPPNILKPVKVEIPTKVVIHAKIVDNTKIGFNRDKFLEKIDDFKKLKKKPVIKQSVVAKEISDPLPKISKTPPKKRKLKLKLKPKESADFKKEEKTEQPTKPKVNSQKENAKTYWSYNYRTVINVKIWRRNYRNKICKEKSRRKEKRIYKGIFILHE